LKIFSNYPFANILKIDIGNILNVPVLSKFTIGHANDEIRKIENKYTYS